MLSFLRKIRQNQLRENKISGYLLYALGEIVLVVIGILIALQINNWNTERLNRQEAREIKENLLGDLRTDSLMLSRYLQLTEQDRRITADLLARWDQESATFDTLIHIVQEFNPSYDNIISFNTNTYESMLSSGKLALLDAGLQDKLLEVKNWQAICLDEINIRQYSEFIKEYTIKYPLGPRRNSYAHALRWQIDDRRDFIMRFSGLCWFKNFLLNQYHRRYSETLEVTNELIRDLNAQL